MWNWTNTACEINQANYLIYQIIIYIYSFVTKYTLEKYKEIYKVITIISEW